MSWWGWSNQLSRLQTETVLCPCASLQLGYMRPDQHPPFQVSKYRNKMHHGSYENKSSSLKWSQEMNQHVELKNPIRLHSSMCPLCAYMSADSVYSIQCLFRTYIPLSAQLGFSSPSGAFQGHWDCCTASLASTLLMKTSQSWQLQQDLN